MSSPTVIPEPCPGCGVRLPETTGPRHSYMTCSPACWARYGELLAAQYSDPQRMAFHQLIVDTYAVQHPDGDDPRAIQSVGIHLMTLCLFLEHDTDPAFGSQLHRRMVQRPIFQQLMPPARRGELTMLSIPIAGGPQAARAAAYAWAAGTWTAWRAHHQTVRFWLAESGMLAPER